eukprot:704041-Pelagomonas_calceolata.AAC.2
MAVLLLLARPPTAACACAAVDAAVVVAGANAAPNPRPHHQAGHLQQERAPTHWRGPPHTPLVAAATTTTTPTPTAEFHPFHPLSRSRPLQWVIAPLDAGRLRIDATSGPQPSTAARARTVARGCSSAGEDASRAMRLAATAVLWGAIGGT